jgi:transposase
MERVWRASHAIAARRRAYVERGEVVGAMDRRRVCGVERVASGVGRRRRGRGDRDGRPTALGTENARLRAENERLRERVRSLEARVEELRRAAKRQAAPFSRGEPKRAPARGGRRPGAEYGRQARREVPVPDRVDEEVFVPLPDACPGCGGGVEFDGVWQQYQEDIPPPAKTIVRRFDIAYGRCRCCGRRVRGRHPDQTSDAVGACASQVGPRAVALAAQLHKELGLPVGKVAQVLLELCGLRVTPGGLYQALHRQARAAGPTYQALVEGVRASPAVAADETGWRVAGLRQWLWDFVGDNVTVYLIAAGRGYEQAQLVLGADYSGVLERDGWAPYRRFEHARHQTCLAHLLRRAHAMIEDAQAGQARIPHAMRRILQDALELRAQRDAGDAIDADAFGLQVQELEARTDKLLAGNPTHAPNRKLLAHLATEREHLLTFLTEPGVQATNWRAEQGLRPAVTNRKHWGGNKTWQGAHTQQVLMSVIRTARQQQLDPVALLAGLARQPQPSVAIQLQIPGRSPPQ